MNLQQLVNDNYKKHPSFGNALKLLRIDTELVLEFNKLYGNPKNYRTIAELSMIKNQCLKLSTEIFGALAKLVNNENHSQFFLYLGNSVSDFLEEEFEYRKKILENYNLKGNSPYFNQLTQLDIESHFLGKLSTSTTEHILKISTDALAEFRHRVTLGKVSRTDLSINNGDLVRKIGWILDKDFKKSGVFDIVSDFFGFSYDHTGLSLELSTERSTWWKNKISDVQPPKTMYAHLDEAFFAPKSIVYLSEVFDYSGPTSCYPGIYKAIENNPLQDIVGRVVGTISSKEELKDYYKSEYHQAFSSEKFREHYMSIPELIRFNSHFGWDVAPNSALETLLVQNEKILLGSPGDYVVFDGAQLLHRGGLITKGERVVLQVVFNPNSKVPFSTKVKWAIKKLMEGI